MSKTTKPSYKKLLKTLEELQHLLSWISDILSYWKFDNIFPCNLIKKCCDVFNNDLEVLLSEN